MKFRTGFVTNSSSESYGEVVIDNPVLLEIIAKYKFLGVFEWDDISILNPEGNTIEREGRSYDTPKSLDEALMEIIYFLQDNILPTDKTWNIEHAFKMRDELIGEIQLRADEINNAFRSIYWYRQIDTYYNGSGYYTFNYDQVNGESYDEEETGDLYAG